MAQVQLEGVTKRFGDVTVVRRVDLTIQDREFLVLVGPSGCGKSTTLRMIAGLEEITEGDLSIGGRRMNDLAPKDRDIAMVFQSYALYPHMSVFENMAFGLRLRKMPQQEVRKRVEEAAQILDLTPYLQRKPSALSGGQRQRVAMGRAIVRQPSVFLFDEPLSNLDAKLRVQMRTEIARLHRRLGSTSIYVTHDQVEAMTLADRIVVMKDGEVQQVGSPMELYHHPANLFVATFIGSPAMNLLEGSLQRKGDQLLFQHPSFSLPLPANLRKALDKKDSGEVVLGVRPQHIDMAGKKEDADLSSLPLEVCEPLGAETFLYFPLGEGTLIARQEDVGKEWKVGEKFHLRFSPDALHLFDKDSTNAIRLAE
ncbi:MAG: sn-glycerol-3-phosphate ABC transporter ATP-binding protein UgpC [Myxococcales bacterium]|nr:sn-glycerol-3-phosphate ABC transporter ATP-binding protein UgpC [Myxococcales bacterium]